MTLYNLSPQYFATGAATQLPAIDFYQFALSQLPTVYQNATNFLTIMNVISDQKQVIYNIIVSLVNTINAFDSGNTNPPTLPSATPVGTNTSINTPYLNMTASVFNAPYSNTDDDTTILTSIMNIINYVNSRGRPQDFFNYFNFNGLQNYFTNANIQESGNATVTFTLPISQTGTPNPLLIFLNNMQKIKGAGIEIILGLVNVPFFQYGKLPTQSGPDVAPGNLGFGVLLNGVGIYGGNLQSL